MVWVRSGVVSSKLRIHFLLADSAGNQMILINLWEPFIP